MYYLFVNLINATTQNITLNSLTGFDDGNMFVTDGSLTVPANGGECPVAAYAEHSATMTYNVTEDMVVQLQWTMENAPPTSFTASVQGGSEYSVNGSDTPVVTQSSENAHDYFYTYTFTVVKA